MPLYGSYLDHGRSRIEFPPDITVNEADTTGPMLSFDLLSNLERGS